MMANGNRKLVYTGLFMAIGLILPMFVKFIPVSNPGAIFLPMHIPVLLCGFICGIYYGAVCGMILPLLSFCITGIPPIFPVGISMVFELCAYGTLAGLLYKLTKGKIYLTLIGAMIGGRIVMGIANVIIFGLADKAYGTAAFISGAFITALPGIIIQIILIPVIVKAMKKSRLML